MTSADTCPYRGLESFTEEHADGRWVVSAGVGGTVRIWDWADEASPTVLRGHPGAVNSAASSPDGR